MAEVVAKTKGYFGGIIREIGDVFSVPDDLWADKDRRPSWAEATKFGGKGDHDGDGKAGGSVPSAPAGPFTVGADWQNLKVAERKALAKDISGKAVGTAGEADEIIEAYVASQKPAPFSDAPEPVRVKNEINEATGGTQPDWIAPTKPVMADN